MQIFPRYKVTFYKLIDVKSVRLIAHILVSPPLEVTSTPYDLSTSPLLTSSISRLSSTHRLKGVPLSQEPLPRPLSPRTTDPDAGVLVPLLSSSPVSFCVLRRDRLLFVPDILPIPLLPIQRLSSRLRCYSF